MFGYYPWFEEQGIAAFQNQNQYEYLQSSLVGMISKVVMIVALATILMGVISWINAKNMRDKQINKGTIRWMIACVIIHLIIYDVIGVVLYLLATTMYMSKNKAIKILKTENGIF
jgi:TctA family transporter